MSLVEFNRPAKATQAFSNAAAKEGVASPDAVLVAACVAARAAMAVFDEAARRGEDFGTLCELSHSERSAVGEVCGTRSATPLGVAEKALLLDCFLSSARRSEVTQETLDVALSLANDALALAKAVAAKSTGRLARTTTKS